VSRTPDPPFYSSDEMVTLNAVPDPGYIFVSWTGAASGSSSTIDVLMNGDVSVTETFAEILPYPLTVTFAGVDFSACLGANEKAGACNSSIAFSARCWSPTSRFRRKLICPVSGFRSESPGPTRAPTRSVPRASFVLGSQQFPQGPEFLLAWG
jgi:hypothetical protein